MVLLKEILNASVEDKLNAIEQLWNSIDWNNSSVEVPIAQQVEAKMRLKKMNESGKHLSLDELKKNIETRYGL